MTTYLCLECGERQESADVCDFCGGEALASREILADLAHRLWMHWSQHLAAEEQLSTDRRKRWETLWTEYGELDDSQQETDRVLVEEMLRQKRHPEGVWL